MKLKYFSHPLLNILTISSLLVSKTIQYFHELCAECLQFIRLDFTIMVSIYTKEERYNVVVSERQVQLPLFEEWFHKVTKFFLIEWSILVFIKLFEETINILVELSWVVMIFLGFVGKSLKILGRE